MLGAESLLRTLTAHGIDTCFMNPGTSEMQFVIALDQVPAMRAVLCLAEVVCSGAADGYARMTRRPAATLLHLGPGMGNALSNFHNARKARSPVVNVVGEHATFHMAYDAPLTADTEAFAHPVSNWTRTVRVLEDLPQETAAAVEAAMMRPRGVASLIVPADFTWSEAPAPGRPLAWRVEGAAPEDRVEAAARMLRAEGAALLVAGDALLEPGLSYLTGIAAKTGARIFANRFSARLPRGRGRHHITRIPYFPEASQQALAQVKRAVLVGMSEPVSFFGYPGVRSTKLPVDCEILTLAHDDYDEALSLEMLARELGAEAMAGPVSDVVPEMPTGEALTVQTLGQALAALLPEGAILSDEMVSSGEAVIAALTHAAPHDVLAVTGGSIGQGLPVALGAAIACPERKVFALEGDGSGMYSLQALWTMARENCDVCVIIFNNRRYQILDVEVRRTGDAQAGPAAEKMLALTGPDLDWVKMAEGMGVAGARVETLGGFVSALRGAIGRRGPYLIEAVL